MLRSYRAAQLRSPSRVSKRIKQLEEKMYQPCADLEFEAAAGYARRDTEAAGSVDRCDARPGSPPSPGMNGCGEAKAKAKAGQ